MAAKETTTATFQEAREKHLRSLDEAYAAVRVVVSDPKWCNTQYDPYRKAIEEFNYVLNRIERLNAASEEASQD